MKEKKPPDLHKVVLVLKGPKKLLEAFREDFKNSSKALVLGQDLGPVYAKWKRKVERYLEKT